MLIGITMLAALAWTGAPAPQESPAIQSKSEEVVLDVIVRDKKGAALTNLAPEDFSVLDNGVSKPIRGFRLVRGNDAVDASGRRMQLDPMVQARLVTLIFGRMDASGRVLSRQAALEFLKSELPKNVYVSVFVLDQTLKGIQDFTNDRELLVKAVERASSASYSEFTGYSTQLREQIQQIVGPNTAGKQSLEEQLAITQPGIPGGPATGLDDFHTRTAELMLDMLNFSQRAEATQGGRDAIYALLAAVQAESQLPGRKAVVYFTSGFFIPQGAANAFESVIAMANRSNLSFYPVDSRGLISDSMNKEAGSQAAAAAQSSADTNAATELANVVITARSAVAFDQAMEAGKYNTQDTLAILAEETGGFLTANTNDFRGPVRRIAEELETYYEISYDPALATYDGSFHHVAVKTARAGLRAETREGYFALPRAVMQKSLSAFELPLLRALTVHPPVQGFPFESGALHFRGEDTNATCSFLIDMPMANVTVRANAETGKLKGGVAYVALVQDGSGEVVRKFQGDIPVELSSGQELSFKQSRFTSMEYFDLPPGHYTVGVALIDKESGRTAARHSVLVVPRIGGGLAMSSVSLIRKWRAKEPDAPDDDPFVVEDKTVTPTLAPRVNKSVSTSLPFYIVAYPDAKNDAPVTLTMEFDREGKVRRAPPIPLPKPDARGRIQYVARAPIGQFDPGDYAVRFVVKQGSETAEEKFAIALEP
jgi:VWFA-related protein